MPNMKTTRKCKSTTTHKQKKSRPEMEEAPSEHSSSGMMADDESDSPIVDKLSTIVEIINDNLHEPSTSAAYCCCHVPQEMPKNTMPDDAIIDQFRITPTSKNLIQELVEVDRLEELISLKGLRIRSEHEEIDQNLTAYQRLSRIGDEVLEHLVDWTKTLPFYDDFPVEVHSCLLTQRWPELVLLSACFYAVIMQDSENLPVCATCEQPQVISFKDPMVNLRLLRKRLSAVMHKDIPLDYIATEASSFVESFTSLLDAFNRLKVTEEAYVCLKAITFLHACPDDSNTNNDDKCPKIPPAYLRRIRVVQDQFVKTLQIHLSQCQEGPRMTDIFNWLPALQATADVLLKSKMFYMPFLICKNPEPFSAESSVHGSPSHSETESDERN